MFEAQIRQKNVWHPGWELNAGPQDFIFVLQNYNFSVLPFSQRGNGCSNVIIGSTNEYKVLKSLTVTINYFDVTKILEK